MSIKAYINRYNMRLPFIRPGRNLTFLLSASFLLIQCTSQIPSTGKLEAGFRDPSIENRPLAFWDWLNGYVDTTKMVFELEEMKRQGMRGAFIWDVGALSDPGKMIPAGPAFLGEQSLKTISLALKTAGRLGLEMGMIASSSWNAGGDWIGEADASKQLLSTVQMVTGPSKQRIKIGRPESEAGKDHASSLISSIAIPHSNSKKIDFTRDKAISLDEFRTSDQFIDWQVPEGKWDVITFFMYNTGQPLECPSPNSNGTMIDHLSQRATKIHFDTILTRLASISTPESRLKFLEVDSYEVCEKPAKSSCALLTTVMLAQEPRAELLPKRRTPPCTITGPVKSLVVRSMSVPELVLVRPVEPLTRPLPLNV